MKWGRREALAPGRHTLAFEFTYDGGGIGKGTGCARLSGKEADSKHMGGSITFILAWDEAFNVGLDTGTAVDPADYQVPFRFTGKLEKLTIALKGPPLSKELEEQIQEQQKKNGATQ